MKPTITRSTEPRSPSRPASCRSRPGAVKPVQDATTRWVIAALSAALRSSAATARIARSIAQRCVQRHARSGAGKPAALIKSLRIHLALVEPSDPQR